MLAWGIFARAGDFARDIARVSRHGLNNPYFPAQLFMGH